MLCCFILLVSLVSYVHWLFRHYAIGRSSAMFPISNIGRQYFVVYPLGVIGRLCSLALSSLCHW